MRLLLTASVEKANLEDTHVFSTSPPSFGALLLPPCLPLLLLAVLIFLAQSIIPTTQRQRERPQPWRVKAPAAEAGPLIFKSYQSPDVATEEEEEEDSQITAFRGSVKQSCGGGGSWKLCPLDRRGERGREREEKFVERTS